jgi:tRNA(fMet)-specific endonuclease VapC
MVISRLLDTNTISELSKSEPSSLIVERFKYYDKQLAIPSVVWHELQYGWHKMPEGSKKRHIGSFLQHVVSVLPVINYDTKAGTIHAELRANAEAKGRVLPFADSQIASIAIANGLVLVTRNTKYFESLSALMLENWFE